MISSQDFERLSTYLDGQLSPKETAALEARLAREPELKATLDELRQTVRALRSLPAIRPPRNFTLSAQPAGFAPQRRFFPALRFATSLAALALVLVFAGDLLTGRPPALSPAAPMPNATVAQQSIAPSEEAPPVLARSAEAMPTTAAVAAAPAAMPTQPLDQSQPAGNATGAGESLPTTPSAEAAVLAAAPAAAAPTVALPTTADKSTIVATEPVATEPMATVAAAAKLAPTEPAAQPAPAETSTPPAPPTVETYALSTPEPAVEQVKPNVPPSGTTPALPWRAVEIGLIGLTLLLAGFTWLMRRR